MEDVYRKDMSAYRCKVTYAQLIDLSYALIKAAKLVIKSVLQQEYQIDEYS